VEGLREQVKTFIDLIATGENGLRSSFVPTVRDSMVRVPDFELIDSAGGAKGEREALDRAIAARPVVQGETPLFCAKLDETTPQPDEYEVWYGDGPPIRRRTPTPKPDGGDEAVAWRGRGEHGWTYTDSPHPADVGPVWEPLYTRPSAAAAVPPAGDSFGGWAAWLRDRGQSFDPYIQGPMFNQLADWMDSLAAAPTATASVLEGRAPDIAAAEAMGAHGAPSTEGERMAFEAWMRGHCWALCATWSGTEYRSDAEQDGSFSPYAARTRMLWAAWRDRAALVSEQAAAPAAPKGGVVVTDEMVERAIHAFENSTAEHSDAGFDQLFRETLTAALATPRAEQENE
jgi:hypothetical protein